MSRSWLGRTKPLQLNVAVQPSTANLVPPPPNHRSVHDHQGGRKDAALVSPTRRHFRFRCMYDKIPDAVPQYPESKARVLGRLHTMQNCTQFRGANIWPPRPIYLCHNERLLQLPKRGEWKSEWCSSNGVWARWLEARAHEHPRRRELLRQIVERLLVHLLKRNSVQVQLLRWDGRKGKVQCR